MNEIFISVLLYLISGLIVCLFPTRKMKAVGLIISIGASLTVFIKALYFLIYYPGSELSAELIFGYPFEKVVFTVDSLSAFFLLFISAGFIFNAYSGYMSRSGEKSFRFGFLFLSVFYFSIITALTVSHSLLFLMLWEFMTLSSFGLIMLNHRRIEEFPFRINFLTAMHIGMFFLLGAFLYISSQSGSYFFTAPTNAKGIVFMILFIGFAFKSEFVPFHPWAPILYPEMPSHVSAAFSGFMMKMGIYGILRIIISFGGVPLWCGYLVLGISLMTTCYGIIFAFVQRDLKKLLAYSSIENMGIIGIGIGGGIICFNYGNTAAGIFSFGGALIHSLNHSVFKPLLFYSSASAEKTAGTRDIEKMGGIMKTSPVSGITFLAASLSICGIPLFAGFAGEFSIYIGLLKSIVKNPSAGNVVISVLAVSLLALSGAVALITFAKAFGIVFLGEKRSKINHNRENRETFFPLITLSIVSLVSGIFPIIFVKLASKPLLQIFGMDFYASFGYITKLFNDISRVSIMLVSVIISLCFLRWIASAGKIIYRGTWSCGYNKTDSRIQYTGFSFSENFSSVISVVLQQKDKMDDAGGIFPKGGYYAARFFDIFDSKIYCPLMKYYRLFLSVFFFF